MISAPIEARDKLRLMVLLGSFWPGNEASGPYQSFLNWCRALGNHFEFKMLARDRPYGAKDPLIRETGWIDRGFASFAHRPVGPFGPRDLARLLCQTSYDILVLNSFFDAAFTLSVLLLRKWRRIPQRPVILSPRGTFSAGAMQLKSYKKRPYVAMVAGLRLLDGVWLHAASELERTDILRVVPGHDRLVVAPNVRFLEPLNARGDVVPRASLKLTFLSRIDRKKNLDFALQILCGMQIPVEFDIFGPVSDERYWHECQTMIEQLPATMTVRYKGTLEQSDIGRTLADYDAMFLPTRGENYGHAILDALAAGIPVIISDQTPWTALESQGAGWSLPLDAPEAFVSALNELYHASPEARRRLRSRARALAERILGEEDAVARTQEMFRRVLLESRHGSGSAGDLGAVPAMRGGHE